MVSDLLNPKCDFFTQNHAGARSVHSLVFTDILALSVPPKKRADGAVVKDHRATTSLTTALTSLETISKSLRNYDEHCQNNHQAMTTCKVRFNNELASNFSSIDTNLANSFIHSSSNKNNSSKEDDDDDEASTFDGSLLGQNVETKDNNGVIFSPLSAGSHESFFARMETILGVTEKMKEEQTFDFDKQGKSTSANARTYKNSMLETLLHACIKKKQSKDKRVIDESYEILDALNTQQHCAKDDWLKNKELFCFLPSVWTLQCALNVFECVTQQEDPKDR